MSDDEQTEQLLTPGQLLDAGIVAFQTIPHPMRGWAMIGCYMGFFAMLENTLAQRLGLVLGADVVLTAIVGRNMGAIEKVRAVRTVVNLAVRSDEDRKWLDAMLKRAEKAAEQRNIVAHTPFGASSESDGIGFYAVEAKSKFRVPSIDWSIPYCDEQIDELRTIADALDSSRATEALLAARELLKKAPTPDLRWLEALIFPDDRR